MQIDLRFETSAEAAANSGAGFQPACFFQSKADTDRQDARPTTFCRGIE
jgi:hypothetical protein